MKKIKPKYRKRLSPPTIKPQKGLVDKEYFELFLKYLPPIVSATITAIGGFYFGHPI